MNQPTPPAERPATFVDCPRVLSVGSVPYLNVRPLLRALREAFALPGPWHRAYPGGLQVQEAVPRELATLSRSGHFDAAIVPVFEYLTAPVGNLLPGTCIGARGPVESVILFANDPLDQLHTVELDTASLTSVHLIRILLSDWAPAMEYRDLTPGLPPLTPGTGRLIIGDAALRLRGTHALEWDLAEAWIARTGLPFVFAAWHGYDEQDSALGSPLSDLFLTMAEKVQDQIPVAAREDSGDFGMGPEFALAYLSRAIHFQLGSRELAGLSLFAEECHRMGWIPIVPGGISALESPVARQLL